METYADKDNTRRYETFHRNRLVLYDPKTTVQNLAKVIAEDAAVTGSLMHFIKSLGFSPEACTISNNIGLLGLDVIEKIVAERHILRQVKK